MGLCIQLLLGLLEGSQLLPWCGEWKTGNKNNSSSRSNSSNIDSYIIEYIIIMILN